MVQEVFGLCAVPSRTEAHETLQTRKAKTRKSTGHVEDNPKTRRREGARQNRERTERREVSQEKSTSGCGEIFEVARFHGT